MKKTLGRRIEKSYLMLVGIISLFLITGYFSYAYFTLQTEQKNRISIIVGTLNVEMKVDGIVSNKLTVSANTTKEFTVIIKNINDRTARYNFYYTGTLATGVEAGYINESGKQIPPQAKGVNINASGTQTYKIKVKNGTTSSQTIPIVSDVGLDYNDLELPSNGHLFEEMKNLPDDYTSSEFKELITSIVTKGDKTIPSTAIKSWTIGNSVVYVEEEGSGYKLTIGADGKTVLKADSSGLFSEFTNVVTMDLSYLDTSKVTDMSSMFSNCSNLTSLNLSGWITSQVTNMRSMFTYSHSLKIITGLENFNTSKVTDMSNMFLYSSSLTSLNLSRWNTSQVTDMGSMFEHCSNLTSLNLSGWNTSSVTDMGWMFQACYKLTAILGLENFDTSKVRDTDHMFAACYKLTATIRIRNANLTSYSYMFGSAATDANAKITVDYISGASSLVDKMIATASSTSHVVKGSVFVPEPKPDEIA